MRTKEQLLTRLACYGAAEHVYLDDVGYIAWHASTGDNLELLFIEVAEKQKGHGKELVRTMCRQLKDRPPYHSVFGFRRTSNHEASEFYASMHWRQQDLGESIYKEGGTTLMWITWADLLKELGS